MWHFEGLLDTPNVFTIDVGYQGLSGVDHGQCCISPHWYVIDDSQEEDWSQYTALWHSGCDSYFFRALSMYYYSL